MKTTKELLNFWEDQMKLSHTSSNYFFRKSPSHYHMMLLVMNKISKKNLKIDDKKYLNDAMITSIAGISAAMKNTG